MLAAQLSEFLQAIEPLLSVSPKWATIFGAVTAAATSFAALFVWRNWHGAVYVEWAYSWQRVAGEDFPRLLHLRVTVRNNRKIGFTGGTVKVTCGPVSDVRFDHPTASKDKSWDADEAPLAMNIEPGTSQTAKAYVFLDLDALASSSRSRRRCNSRTSLCIQVSIRRKLPSQSKATYKIRIDIPKETIAAAKTAAQK